MYYIALRFFAIVGVIAIMSWIGEFIRWRVDENNLTKPKDFI